MRIFLIMAGFLMVCPVKAAESIKTDAFMAVFTEACMQNFYATPTVRNEFMDSKATRLTEAEAAFFLANKPGTVWGISLGDIKYAVAFREDNICATFAQKAAVDIVEKDFTAVTTNPPAPLKFKKVDDPELGPNKPPIKTIAYSWAQPGKNNQLLYVLTISKDEEAMVQAMATMSVVAKEK